MKNLIRKILKEDFDWVKNVPELEIGDLFEEHEVNFGEGSNSKINVYDNKIEYHLEYDEFNSKALNDYDDWVLNVLIQYGGNPGDYDYYMDDDEMNYIGHYLTPELKDKFTELLTRMGVEDVDGIIHNSFEASEFRILEKYLGSRFYKGRNDWDDMQSEVLYEIGYAIDKNKWTYVKEYYDKTLEKNNVSIEDERYSNDLIITVPFPYKIKTSKGVHSMTNISEILEHIGEDVLGEELSDVYHGEYDTSGAEDGVRFAVERFLEKIEEQIDENEETN
jgi:hypothetical protein